jgi:hypothetical protein
MPISVDAVASLEWRALPSMAIFPQGVTQVERRCNAGERRVVVQLKRCLEDDYLVWHDIPIGPKARQPDFVVLSPRRGILLLEVKDWKRSTLRASTRQAVELDIPRGRVTEPHPLRQARDYAMELVDVMQRDAALVHPEGPFGGKLLFPYGWGAVLSGLRRDEVLGTDFDEVFPPARTLLRDDLADDVSPEVFQQRLWGMFTVTYPCTLTLPQRDRIRWHLFPEVRLPSQASLDLGEEASDGAQLPDLLQVMDLQQEQVARTLGEGHRVIHGAAGSGKTMILVFRAQHLAAATRPDSPILILCYNRALADRINLLIRARGVDERVQVRTFHSWCQDMVRTYHLDVPAKGLTYYDTLAEIVKRAVETGRVPAGQYTALMVDEAHDFQDAWLQIAARMVSPETKSLLVLYDDAQSIYQPKRRKFNFASVGIDARGRTNVLKLNYRNTAEVLALSMHCAQSLLEDAGQERGEDDIQLVRPASAGRRGALPVLIEARSDREEADLIAERISAAQTSGTRLEDIVVICRAKYQMYPIELALVRRQLAVQSMNQEEVRRFDWKRPSVKLLTMHSVKGLEFPLVFVAGLQALPMKDESLDEAVRLLYVAMTRSTEALVLSAHGESAVVTRVRASLRETTQQFARQGALKPFRSGSFIYEPRN